MSIYLKFYIGYKQSIITTITEERVHGIAEWEIII